MKESTWTQVLISACRRIAMCLMGWSLLSACQSMPNGVPWNEIRSFTVPPESIQALSEVRVRWLIRADAREYCSQQLQRTSRAPRAGTTSAASSGEPASPRVLACSVWNEHTKECTIVTEPTTSHVIMGHEVHHCFSGHFHKM